MKNDIKFAYYDVNGGKVTAAFKLLGEANSTDRTVEFAFSYCNPNDVKRFEKAKGRMISTNRLHCVRTKLSAPISLDYSGINESVYKQVIKAIEPYIAVGLDREIQWMKTA